MGESADTRTQEQVEQDLLRRFRRLTQDSSVIYSTETAALVGETRLVTDFFQWFFFVVTGIGLLLHVQDVLSRRETLAVTLGIGVLSIATLLAWRITVQRKAAGNLASYERSLHEHQKLLGFAQGEIS